MPLLIHRIVSSSLPTSKITKSLSYYNIIKFQNNSNNSSKSLSSLRLSVSSFSSTASSLLLLSSHKVIPSDSLSSNNVVQSTIISTSVRNHNTKPIPISSESAITDTDMESQQPDFKKQKTVQDKTVTLTSDHIDFGKKACDFLYNATDPYFAVQTATQRLKDVGFIEIDYNNDTFDTNLLKNGGKYYYVVHDTTFVAFCIGQNYIPGEGGFHIIGGHTDSPNLSIKPKSKKTSSKVTNVTQLAVQCYGGGLWHTWFDRDLSLSGQVFIRNKGQVQEQSSKNEITTKLVKITDPVARVSTLCIHLQSPTEREAFKVNKEDHTSPIIGATNIKIKEEIESAISNQINTTTTDTPSDDDGTFENDVTWIDGQEPLLLQRLYKELNVNSETHTIIDFHLNLYDSQRPTLGGMNQEFLYSGRLDNLATVFCATEAIASYDPTSTESSSSSSASDIKMIVCFDHEEVGSESLNGAGSPIVEQAVRRISSALLSSTSTTGTTNTIGYDELYAKTISKSFCLSIDQAHAIHPNYASKHDSNHAPTMNGGIVIKNNANQRYATSRSTGLLLREIGRLTNVPVQEFAVKNDCPCGSTIGPTISKLTGIRTVDAGMAQLSMHSCREVMGTIDLSYGYQLFLGFFQYFRSIDSNTICKQVK